MSRRRDRVIRELQEIAAGRPTTSDGNFKRFRECEQLQKASGAIGAATAALAERRHVGAFTAATHTPLCAPPGWLPPPI